MAEWTRTNTVLTKLGNKLLSYAVAGVATLNLTRVIVRETVSTPNVNRDYNLNSVSSDIKQTGSLLKYRGGIENPDTGDYDTSLITARFSNEDLPENNSFKIRQIVLLASLTNIDTSAMLQYDPDFEDPGEVPYIVAQTTGEDDYDLMPSRSENPTSYDYDIYIVHTGTASITVSIQTTGYVSESEFNRTITEIKTSINAISVSKAGQNTKDCVFQVWTPHYTDDDDPSGGRVWSKAVDSSGNVIITEISGQKSAERFNKYDENANIATGDNSHVEGNSNAGISSDCHIEGVENHSGSENWGIHIEGRRNYANLGWFQHIEGENNQSAGYATHIEGVNNKAVNSNSSVGILHIEGCWNTVKNGGYHHIEGENNTVEQGRTHHIEGKLNTVEQGNFHHVEGYSNSITGVNDCNHVGGQLNKVNNCGESNVSGRENTVTDSSQSTVSGYKNVVSVSESASVSGLNNTVVNSPRTSVSGTSNTVTNSRGTNVSGDNNKVVKNCYESSISGWRNSLTRSAHTSVSGYNNIVSDSDNSIYSGSSNQSTISVSDSFVSGSNNRIKNSSRSSSGNMIVSGNKNTVTDSSESEVIGYNNSVTYAVNSFVTGSGNSVIVDSNSPDSHVESCVISGASNIIERTLRSNVTGIGNKITDYKPNGVSGERALSANNSVSGENNDLNGVFSSVTTGTSNTVTNIHDSVISGRSNRVSSTVSDTESNCVLCAGFDCTVVSSGSPIFATGSHNTIIGNNSAVFGSNNIVSSEDQLVSGHFNVEDTSNEYAVIVGGGTSSLNRKNIMSLDWSGVLNVKDIVLGDSDSSINSRLLALENQIKQLTGQST